MAITKESRHPYHIESTENIEQQQSPIIRLGENMGNGKQKWNTSHF